MQNKKKTLATGMATAMLGLFLALSPIGASLQAAETLRPPASSWPQEWPPKPLVGDNAGSLQKILDEALSAYEGKQYRKTLQLSDRILSIQHDHFLALVLKGFANVDLGHYPEARKYVTWAHWVKPASDLPLRVLAYLAILERGDLDEAKFWMRQAVRMFSEPSGIQNVRDDAASYARSAHPALFQALVSFAEAQFRQYDQGRDWGPLVSGLGNAFPLLERKNFASARSAYQKVMDGLRALPEMPPAALVDLLATQGETFDISGDPEGAILFLEQAWKHLLRHGVDNPYARVWITWKLGRLYQLNGQNEKALAMTDRALPVRNQQPFPYLSCELLLTRINARQELKTNQITVEQNREILEDAKTLSGLAERLGDGGLLYSARANNAMGTVYLKSTREKDRQLARQFLTKAGDQARRGGDAALANTIDANLAIVRFQQGDKAGAMQTMRASADAATRQGDYLGAALTLNNLGAMFLFQGDAAGAVEPLREAVNYVETHRKRLSKESRRDFLEAQISAYQFLAMALGKLNRPAELFEVLESSRGRVLAETLSLGKGLRRADLEWVRDNLGADEAALLYGVTEPGAVAVSIVTREGVKSVYVEQRDLIKRLQRHFSGKYGFTLRLDQDGQRGFDPFKQRGMNQVGEMTGVLRSVMEGKGLPPEVIDGVRDYVLQTFYGLLLAPLEPHLAGKRRLLISPDEYLSFIPFEALMDGQGRYVAERYSIRYAPSMTVFRMVSDRNYASDRKNMLAFGDARYAPYEVKLPPTSTEAEFRVLAGQVDEDLRLGRSQRLNYGRLGVSGRSWTYLPGTKTEILAIQKFTPGVDAHYAADFTENRIKALSRSGELARYKVLHLATHGLVMPTLPELSTVIATLPMREVAGEDGYITAAEIKDLKLNADFVALSACQTGLGKIYAGEGVAGLNQALLQAGANATAVSLWSVSDDATMRFMVGLYDLAHNQGMHYADAMTEMKRRFIRGEFGNTYRKPGFWAPFAYYGR